MNKYNLEIIYITSPYVIFIIMVTTYFFYKNMLSGTKIITDVNYGSS